MYTKRILGTSAAFGARLHRCGVAPFVRATALSLSIVISMPVLVTAQTVQQSAPPKQDMAAKDSPLDPSISEEIDFDVKMVKISFDRLVRAQSKCPPDREAIAREFESLGRLIELIEGQIEDMAINYAQNADEGKAMQRADDSYSQVRRSQGALSDAAHTAFTAFSEAETKYLARKKQLSDRIKKEFDNKLDGITPWSKPVCPESSGIGGGNGQGAGDTGHYDDGHGFGWTKRSDKPSEGDSVDTGHYDDGHGFGWDRKGPEKQPAGHSTESGQDEKSTKKKPDDAQPKRADERRAQPQTGSNGVNRGRVDRLADGARAERSETVKNGNVKQLPTARNHSARQLKDVRAVAHSPRTVASVATMSNGTLRGLQSNPGLHMGGLGVPHAGGLGAMRMSGLGGLGGMRVGGLSGMHLGGMHLGGMGGLARR